MIGPEGKPLLARIRRRCSRALKIARQHLKSLPRRSAGPARAIFVFGRQRSGTRVPMEVMGRSPDIITYSEGESIAFDRSLLKEDAALSTLLRKTPFPFVAFKPICESHRAPELLDSFPGSRALWIFRGFRDAVSSAARKWPDGRRNLVHLASGDLAAAGWRAGGLTAAKLELVRQFYSEDMSPYDAHAVMWYLRNDLFFDLQLERRADLLLIKYEDLVSSPVARFSRVFEFLGCPFEDSFVAAVHRSSVGRSPAAGIRPEIENLCTELEERLERHHDRR